MFAFIGLAFAMTGGNAGADGPEEKQRLAPGKELFTREWLHGDKRSYAGDGLGPVFNARSCVACHHQGGVGGAGGKQSNVTVVSAFVVNNEVIAPPGTPPPIQPDPIKPPEGTTLPERNAKDGIPIPVPVPTPFPASLVQERARESASAKPVKQPDRAKLAKIHPALRTANSFPIHRFSDNQELAKWRFSLFEAAVGAGEGIRLTELETQAAFTFVPQLVPLMGAAGLREIDEAAVELVPSQRNTPALFGVGLIDQVPDRVLEEVAAEQAKAAKASPLDKTPRKTNSMQAIGIMEGQEALALAGRVARLKDGRIGRFGWKANVATLREFTLQACSNEIGLEVPGFPRAVPAWKKNYKAPGLDLSAEQCDQLIQFVASLPPPASRPSETPQHASEVAAGKKLFGEIGCATCHRPKLGNVEGIYSDLLLHDMGQLLSDAGAYGATVQEVASGETLSLPTRSENAQPRTKQKPPKFSAGTREWRTPPLWGLRDSAPYLHDGRADTVADAVAMHGGEGLPTAEAFFALSQRERQQVELFLQSLAAPAN
jgi:CxxC motif-containing protein (DUF1111 family)